MTRCPEVDDFGGDPCALEAGHDGPHDPQLEDEPEATEEERLRLGRVMNDELRPIVVGWRQQHRIPWHGIAGFLAAELVAAYQRAGLSPLRIPGQMAFLIRGAIERELEHDGDLDDLLERQNSPGGES